jgi:hypothetical protein
LFVDMTAIVRLNGNMKSSSDEATFSIGEIAGLATHVLRPWENHRPAHASQGPRRAAATAPRTLTEWR